MLNENAGSLPDIKSGPHSRNRNITDKTKSLLFLLREVPFITLRDVQRFIYPSHKTLNYTYKELRMLVTNNLVNKYMLGNGVFVYYLAAAGKRVAEFFMQESIRFDPKTRSYYFGKSPRRDCEVAAYFHFPSRDLEFKMFTPHHLNAHPFQHTVPLLELYYLLRRSLRIFHVLWLDKVLNKNESLCVPYFPDLLLTNDPFTEEGRIFVEMENSVIGNPNLVGKLDRLCSMPADWYVFLCTSEVIFQNIGRRIRKILIGEAKMGQQTLLVTPRTQAVLTKNLLIGIWQPSSENGGAYMKLKDLALYRYDDEVFDGPVWMKAVDAQHMPLKDSHGVIPIRKHTILPSMTRKPGRSKYLFGEILDSYSEGFRRALNKVLGKNPSGPDSHSQINPEVSK